MNAQVPDADYSCQLATNSHDEIVVPKEVEEVLVMRVDQVDYLLYPPGLQSDPYVAAPCPVQLRQRKGLFLAAPTQH